MKNFRAEDNVLTRSDLIKMMTLCSYGEVVSVISEAIGFFIIGS